MVPPRQADDEQTDGRRPRENQNATLRFAVETETDSLHDLTLRVSSCSQTILRWIRRRTLTERDEVVDQLIDVNKRKLCWSVHRPTRGWYMHLSSPLLPPKCSLAVYAAPRDVHVEVGSSPLLLTLTTRVHFDALDDVEGYIVAEDVEKESVRCNTTREESSRSASGSFVKVDLGTAQPGGLNSAEHVRQTKAEQKDGGATVIVSSVEDGKGRHVRRRSAGNSTSHAGKRSVSHPSSTHAIREEDGTREESESSVSTKVDDSTRAVVQEQVVNNAQSMPRTCSFVLSDGAYGVADDSSGKDAQSSGRLARWAWSLVPEPIRPSLRLDGSKAFSIRWIDAPLQSTEAASVATSLNRSIEIVRFEDRSGWTWKEKRLGTILVQEKAVQALNLDLAMWIALTLSYLDFLEERDVSLS